VNKPWIETHLREALEELEDTLRQLNDPDFTEIEFRVAMEHAYNHLNTAWNSRDQSLTAMANHTMEQFYRWRAFPADIDLGP
jgi:hypothetical protein